MLDTLQTLFTFTESPMTVASLITVTLSCLGMGLLVALTYMYRNTYSKSFVATLVLLPAVVALVIAVVNGNLGAGVAVMGAFSLVRFRSIPGTAREISSIFFAMAIGLAAGMGYLAAAFLFLVIVGAASMIINSCRFGEGKEQEKELRITIPETLDYSHLFDDLFSKYTKSARLMRVKTTNMGSLYELQYRILISDETKEKEMLDEIRCRNSNLNIVCGYLPVRKEEL